MYQSFLFFSLFTFPAGNLAYVYIPHIHYTSISRRTTILFSRKHGYFGMERMERYSMVQSIHLQLRSIGFTINNKKNYNKKKSGKREDEITLGGYLLFFLSFSVFRVSLSAVPVGFCLFSCILYPCLGGWYSEPFCCFCTLFSMSSYYPIQFPLSGHIPSLESPFDQVVFFNLCFDS